MADNKKIEEVSKMVGEITALPTVAGSMMLTTPQKKAPTVVDPQSVDPMDPSVVTTKAKRAKPTTNPYSLSANQNVAAIVEDNKLQEEADKTGYSIKAIAEQEAQAPTTLTSSAAVVATRYAAKEGWIGADDEEWKGLRETDAFMTKADAAFKAKLSTDYDKIITDIQNVQGVQFEPEQHDWLRDSESQKQFDERVTFLMQIMGNAAAAEKIKGSTIASYGAQLAEAIVAERIAAPVISGIGSVVGGAAALGGRLGFGQLLSKIPGASAVSKAYGAFPGMLKAQAAIKASAKAAQKYKGAAVDTAADLAVGTGQMMATADINHQNLSEYDILTNTAVSVLAPPVAKGGLKVAGKTAVVAGGLATAIPGVKAGADAVANMYRKAGQTVSSAKNAAKAVVTGTPVSVLTPSAGSVVDDVPTNGSVVDTATPNVSAAVDSTPPVEPSILDEVNAGTRASTESIVNDLPPGTRYDPETHSIDHVPHDGVHEVTALPDTHRPPNTGYERSQMTRRSEGFTAFGFKHEDVVQGYEDVAKDIRDAGVEVKNGIDLAGADTSPAMLQYARDNNIDLATANIQKRPEEYVKGYAASLGKAEVYTNAFMGFENVKFEDPVDRVMWEVANGPTPEARDHALKMMKNHPDWLGATDEQIINSAEMLTNGIVKDMTTQYDDILAHSQATADAKAAGSAETPQKDITIKPVMREANPAKTTAEDIADYEKSQEEVFRQHEEYSKAFNEDATPEQEAAFRESSYDHEGKGRDLDPAIRDNEAVLAVAEDSQTGEVVTITDSSKLSQQEIEEVLDEAADAGGVEPLADSEGNVALINLGEMDPEDRIRFAMKYGQLMGIAVTAGTAAWIYDQTQGINTDEALTAAGGLLGVAITGKASKAELKAAARADLMARRAAKSKAIIDGLHAQTESSMKQAFDNVIKKAQERDRLAQQAAAPKGAPASKEPLKGGELPARKNAKKGVDTAPTSVGSLDVKTPSQDLSLLGNRSKALKQGSRADKTAKQIYDDAVAEIHGKQVAGEISEEKAQELLNSLGAVKTILGEKKGLKVLDASAAPTRTEAEQALIDQKKAANGNLTKNDALKVKAGVYDPSIRQQGTTVTLKGDPGYAFGSRFTIPVPFSNRVFSFRNPFNNLSDTLGQSRSATVRRASDVLVASPVAKTVDGSRAGTVVQQGMTVDTLVASTNKAYHARVGNAAREYFDIYAKKHPARNPLIPDVINTKINKDFNVETYLAAKRGYHPDPDMMRYVKKVNEAKADLLRMHKTMAQKLGVNLDLSEELLEHASQGQKLVNIKYDPTHVRTKWDHSAIDDAIAKHGRAKTEAVFAVSASKAEISKTSGKTPKFLKPGDAHWLPEFEGHNVTRAGAVKAKAFLDAHATTKGGHAKADYTVVRQAMINNKVDPATMDAVLNELGDSKGAFSNKLDFETDIPGGIKFKDKVTNPDGTVTEIETSIDMLDLIDTNFAGLTNDWINNVNGAGFMMTTGINELGLDLSHEQAWASVIETARGIDGATAKEIQMLNDTRDKLLNNGGDQTFNKLTNPTAQALLSAATFRSGATFIYSAASEVISTLPEAVQAAAIRGMPGLDEILAFASGDVRFLDKNPEFSDVLNFYGILNGGGHISGLDNYLETGQQIANKAQYATHMAQRLNGTLGLAETARAMGAKIAESVVLQDVMGLAKMTDQQINRMLGAGFTDAKLQLLRDTLPEFVKVHSSGKFIESVDRIAFEMKNPEAAAVLRELGHRLGASITAEGQGLGQLRAWTTPMLGRLLTQFMSASLNATDRLRGDIHHMDRHTIARLAFNFMVSTGINALRVSAAMIGYSEKDREAAMSPKNLLIGGLAMMSTSGIIPLALSLVSLLVPSDYLPHKPGTDPDKVKLPMSPVFSLLQSLGQSGKDIVNAISRGEALTAAQMGQLANTINPLLLGRYMMQAALPSREEQAQQSAVRRANKAARDAENQ